MKRFIKSSQGVFATNSDFPISISFRRPLIFQVINSGRSSSIRSKYRRFIQSVCKYLGIRRCMLKWQKLNSFDRWLKNYT